MTNPYEQYTQSPSATPATAPANPYAQYAQPSESPAPSTNPYAQYSSSPAAPAAPSDPNYFQRVAQDWKNNTAAGHASDAAVASGEISPLHYGFQTLGQGVVGNIAAPIQEGIKSALSLLPTPPQPIQDAEAWMGNHVQAYLADKPNLARDLQSLSNVAAVVPVTDALGDGISGAPTAGWKGAIPKSSDIHAEADKAYAVADTSGAGGTPQAANNYIDQAKANASQSARDLKQNGPDPVQTYLNNMENVRGQPFPIADAQAEDIKLREAATKAYRDGDNSLGERWNNIRQALRDNIYNQPDPALITGGPEGFNALQEGNRLKSQAYTVENIENAVSDAMTKDVQSTAIKNKFASMSKDIAANGSKGLSQDTVDAINYAGKTGLLTGALKTMGSKLGAAVGGAVGGSAGFAAGGPIGAAAGGTIGTGVGYVAGAPFRAAATAIQLGKANDVLRTIIDRPTFTPPSLTAPIELPPMLQLTNQYADTAAQRYAASQRSNSVGTARTAFGPDASTTGINMQGVPYNTGALGEPLGLPSPQSLSKTELATNPQGQSAWRTNAEQASVDASRQNDVATGMSMSVRQSIVKNAMSAKFGPAWDTIQSSEKSKILDQMDQMWDGKTQQSLQSMIDVAHQNLQDLNAANGSSIGINNFGQALRAALKTNFRIPPSLTTTILPQ